MKGLYFTYIIAIVLFLSCQKSHSDTTSSPYYIKLTIDSVPRTFNADAKAVKFTSDSIFNLSITGNPGAATGAESLSLTIQNNPGKKPLVAGTYSQLDPNFEMSAIYNPNSTSYIYSVGQYSNPSNPLIITIISIDSNTVKGTFSGDFYFQYAGAVVSGPDKKTLVGEFYLKLQFLN